MRVQLFVVSDIHLGGEAGPNAQPGFQMCPAPNQQRLAAFINGLPQAGPSEEVRLVLAGDVVDFLAEKPFAALTNDQSTAIKKLENIIERTRPVWNALAGFVKSGGHLTIMLGNHDAELSFPAVRHVLLKTIGEGRVEFIYDNEAFTCGPVLIEHGNRYDSWNAIPHGKMRRLRSELSRGIAAKDAPATPGSQLVVEVMNPLKTDYSWVDLQKPETSATLPILAALGAADLGRIWKVFRKFQQSRAIEYAANGEPVDAEYIAAGAVGDGVGARDQAMWDLAQEIAAGGPVENIASLRDILTGARDVVGEVVRKMRRAALRKALPLIYKQSQLTFDVVQEEDTYLKSAKASGERGFEVVIYGHTHLPKDITFKNKKGQPVRYLNTGTWADLIRIPDSVFSQQAQGPTLDEFVADLEKDDVRRWRRPAPTFAELVIDNQVLVRADLRFYDPAGSESVTTQGLIRRLSAE